MYFKEECVGVICDNCHVTYEERGTGYCVFADYENLHPEEDGWFVEEGVHYCPDCHKIDDNDVMTLKPVAPAYKVIADFPDHRHYGDSHFHFCLFTSYYLSLRFHSNSCFTGSGGILKSLWIGFIIHGSGN